MSTCCCLARIEVAALLLSNVNAFTVRTVVSQLNLAPGVPRWPVTVMKHSTLRPPRTSVVAAQQSLHPTQIGFAIRAAFSSVLLSFQAKGTREIVACVGKLLYVGMSTVFITLHSECICMSDVPHLYVVRTYLTDITAQRACACHTPLTCEGCVQHN